LAAVTLHMGYLGWMTIRDHCTSLLYWHHVDQWLFVTFTFLYIPFYLTFRQFDHAIWRGKLCRNVGTLYRFDSVVYPEDSTVKITCSWVALRRSPCVCDWMLKQRPRKGVMDSLCKFSRKASRDFSTKRHWDKEKCPWWYNLAGNYLTSRWEPTQWLIQQSTIILSAELHPVGRLRSIFRPHTILFLHHQISLHFRIVYFILSKYWALLCLQCKRR